MPTDGDSNSTTLASRLRTARNRVQRKTQSRRADSRAQAREEQMQDDSGQGNGTVNEVRGLANDARELVAAEFGVSTDDATALIKQGKDALDAAGSDSSGLDADGDGDTDILGAIESGIDEGGSSGRESGGSSPQNTSVEAPLGDIEDDLGILGSSGIEDSLDQGPIEDEL